MSVLAFEMSEGSILHKIWIDCWECNLEPEGCHPDIGHLGLIGCSRIYAAIRLEKGLVMNRPSACFPPPAGPSALGFLHLPAGRDPYLESPV